MSKLLTGRNLAIAGGLGGAFLLFRQTRTYEQLDPVRGSQPLRTNGVQNIEDRFTAGGGTPDGTPATATTRGDSKSTASPHEYGKGAGVVGGNSERVKEGEKSQGKSPGNKGATGVVKNVGTLADDEKPHNEAKDAAKKTHSNVNELPKGAVG